MAALDFLEPGHRRAVDVLLGKLRAQRQAWSLFNEYYEEGGPPPVVNDKLRGAYLDLIKRAKSNWTGPVIDVAVERLEVVGIRGLGELDVDFWELVWQTNRLTDAEDRIYTESMIAGVSHVLVDPFPRERYGVTYPRITEEHPTQCAVLVDPGLGIATFGLKAWKDQIGDQYRVNLYTSDAIFKLRAESDPTVRGIATGGSFLSESDRWEPWQDPEDSEWPVRHSLGEVPLVEFVNRDRTGKMGRSEIADVRATQDRINQTLLDRLISQQYDSFRQRWITGMEIPYDPDTGSPVEPFRSAVDRLWIIEEPDAKVGSLEGGDISPLLKAIESDIMELAAISRTPPHLLLGNTNVLPSAEALRSSEAGLISKVRRKQKTYAESWESVLRLAGRVLGVPVPPGLEVIWRFPAQMSMAEQADSATKLATIMPLPAVWERIGASPSEIERWQGAGPVASPAAEPPGEPPIA